MTPTSRIHSHSHSHAHYDWLRLVEVSGPFLSATVLDEAFPTGLDGFDKRTKRDLSRYYDEWLEAYETKDPQFEALHQAWCEAVLRDGLQFQDGDLSDGSAWSVKGEGGVGTFAADKMLKGVDGKPAMFIKVLSAGTKPSDRELTDEWKDTYIEKMTRLCRAHEVRIGLLTNGEQWVLVNAAPGGTLSGHVVWYARLWFQEDSTLRAFLALLGYSRFAGSPKKRLPFLLDESLKHLEEVTDTLGQQVMTAVEVLLEGLDRADLDSGRTLLRDIDPKELYEASLTVMMRLVFILCAEERGLLLLGEKAYDDVYAVSTLRQQLEEDEDKFGAEVLECRSDAWVRLLATFRAVFAGIDHADLRLPAMGGSLFDPDKYPFLEGRQRGESWRGVSYSHSHFTLPLPVDNRTVLLLLESLQVLKHKNGAIPLSFRSLDVEQIGYIYEGLLEFTAARAGEVMLGLKGDKDHPNAVVSLSELHSLRMESEKKLFERMKELTGRSAIAKEYAAEPDLSAQPYLDKACRGDQELKNSVLPFLNWLRLNAWGVPVVHLQDSFYVANGQDRRSTGTHYTPKVLTEMIVKEALEPVVYVGPAQGTPRAEWKLKSPAEILDLKVCDPAMGSGAFLVQACRYLSDRLVDSWMAAEKGGKVIDRYGRVSEVQPQEEMSKVPDDRLCEARRLIAEKCLYGVDINPLAVELAKLSLWLITISKGKPFGFLDHNLKSGDSLLGVSDIRQLTEFRMKPEGLSGNLMSVTIEDIIAQATAEREEIRNAHVRDIRDVAIQEQRNKKVNELTKRIKNLADYFIGQVLVLGKPTKKTIAALDSASLRGSVLLDPESDSNQAAIINKERLVNLAYDLPVGQAAPRRPFHWAIEFPEVFAQGGFDAICGNPPFIGGQRITASFGTLYRDFIASYIGNEIKGSADFVAYFYLRALTLLRQGGIFSLIACNTIAEGATRRVGLEWIANNGGVIIAAHPNMAWPGDAAVSISPVAIHKGKDWRGDCRFGNVVANYISPFLTLQEDVVPLPLVKNDNGAFQGTITLGMGFLLERKEAELLLERNPVNRKVIYPFLNGEDLNSQVGQSATRYAICFFDWPIRRDGFEHWNTLSEDEKRHSIRCGVESPDFKGLTAEQFPDALSLVEKRVKPERELKSDFASKVRWWIYHRAKSDLYHLIGRGDNFNSHPIGWKPFSHPKVLVCSEVSKHLIFEQIENVGIYSANLDVFTRNDQFSVLQSSIHECWARKYSSRLEDRLKYSPGNAYCTFPFPAVADSVPQNIGDALIGIRHNIMMADQIGLTQLYNRFHDETDTDGRVVEMRELQVKIDNAVRDAYGWTDLDLGHGFHKVGYLPENDNIRFTISEPARIEVLKRLAKLNKERWEEEERAGLHKKGKKK